MSLITGSRIGPYEIGALIGEGGMGRVYRATDTTLKRVVAIKVLPPAFAADPDRVSRFDREARLLAALNHPNVAAIHGTEYVDGRRALVMELVEGNTLAEGLLGGRLSVAAATDIARQVAAALEATHDKGIVHRDLKPANIKITPEGVVKVLDFGLAKMASAGDGFAGTASVTVTADATREGVIVGTVSYMSPEQARGQAVDKRTDIWAFGCVLYEMLSGRRPFVGETALDTLAAIVERQPDWSQLPDDVPEALRRLLDRCLEKDARQRLRDIGEARIQLPHRATSPERDSPPSRLRPRDRRLTWHSAAAAVLVGAAGAFVLRQSTSSPAEVEPHSS